MAGERVASGFCRECGAHVRIIKPRCGHAGHAIVSVLTCGLWIPIWALASIGADFSPWRCVSCGGKVCRSWFR